MNSTPSMMSPPVWHSVIDSQRIAAGSFDKSIKVWDVASGEQQAELNGHTNWVFSVAFSARRFQSWHRAAMTKRSGCGILPIQKRSQRFPAIRRVFGRWSFVTDGQHLISGKHARSYGDRLGSG